MSGFFALPADVLAKGKAGCNPMGFKIGLELMVKCNCAKVVRPNAPTWPCFAIFRLLSKRIYSSAIIGLGVRLVWLWSCCWRWCWCCSCL